MRSAFRSLTGKFFDVGACLCKFVELKKPFLVRLMMAFLTFGVLLVTLAGAALSFTAVLDCSQAGFSASSILSCEKRGLCSFFNAMFGLAGLALACELLDDKFLNGNRLFRLSWVPELVSLTASYSYCFCPPSLPPYSLS